MSQRSSPAWVRHVDWAVAITAMVVLVGFHYVFLRSAGALWRDEVDCVNSASLASPKESWRKLQFQSFPIVWSGLLRAWIWIGPGKTDSGIRVLGFVIGLGILAVLWRNARLLGHSPPLVSLTLLGFNSAVLTYGDSIRGYGLGMLTGLLTFGIVWQAIDAPTKGHIGLAILTTLVAVHSNYYNVVFVFAACLGAAAVALRRKSWKSGVLILGTGALCASSLLVYLGTVRKAQHWNVVLHADVNLAWIWQKLQETFASTSEATLWVWIGSALLAAAGAMSSLLPGIAGLRPERQRDAALYCGVALLAGIPAYLLFLKVLGYLMQPWYFLVLMALVTACLDAPLFFFARSIAARSARLTVVVAYAMFVAHPMWTAARTRMTNMDLVASKAADLAKKGDLIVVNPWLIGISFAHYYRGKADWVTVPPVSSHESHRYDLLKAKMMSGGAMEPVLEKIQTALRERHRVFWVGDLFLPKKGEFPADPPPAPNAPWGWADGPYYYHWGLQAGSLIQSHAKAAEQLEVPVQQAVSEYEDAGLYVFSGWWEGDTTR